MQNLEQTFSNNQEQTGQNPVKLETVDLVSSVKEKTETLRRLHTSRTIDQKTIKNVPTAEVVHGQTELTNLEQEEQKTITDWEQTSEAIIDSNFEIIKESWRAAAEEQFGITDFNVEQFRRTLFNDEAMAQAFASGKEWNEIFDTINQYITGESYDMATRAFEAMNDLEEIAPGSVKLLHEKYGISSFQRYPKEMLLNQLNETDPAKEVGLLVFGENDGNGAFDEQQELWEKMHNIKKDTLDFRIVECGSGISLAEQLVKAKEEYAGRVSLAVMSTHSEPDGMYLGVGGTDGGFVSKDSIKELAPTLKDLFKEDAQVIANACSSGAIDGWVKDLSKGASLKAVGPDRPAAIEDIDFVDKEIIPKYYDGNIYSGYHNGFLLTKQNKRSAA